MTTFSRSEFWASLGEDSPRIGLRTRTCRATFLRTAASSEGPHGLSGFVSDPDSTLVQPEPTGQARRVDLFDFPERVPGWRRRAWRALGEVKKVGAPGFSRRFRLYQGAIRVAYEAGEPMGTF